MSKSGNSGKATSISFDFFLTLSVSEKLKNSIFEMPIIPQILNINNFRITNAKSYYLHTTLESLSNTL